MFAVRTKATNERLDVCTGHRVELDVDPKDLEHSPKLLMLGQELACVVGAHRPEGSNGVLLFRRHVSAQLGFERSEACANIVPVAVPVCADEIGVHLFEVRMLGA